MALIIKSYIPTSGKFGSKNEPMRVSQPTTRRQNANDSNGFVTCQLDNRASSNKPSPRENSDWKNSPEPAAHTENTAAQDRVIQPTVDQQFDQLPDKHPKTPPRAEIFRDNDPSKHPRTTGQATISSTHHDLLPAATLSGVPSIVQHCAGRPKTRKALPTSPILPTTTTQSTLPSDQHNNNPTPPESQNSNVSRSTSNCMDDNSEISVDVNSNSDDDCYNDKDIYMGPSPPQRNHPAVIIANDVESDNDSEIPTNVNSDEPEDFNDHDDTSTNSDGLEDFNNEDNISTNSDEPDYSKDIEVEKDSEISANPSSKELEEFNDPAVIVSKDIEWAVDEKQGLLGARRLGEEWEFLTPFETTFEPDYKLLNCEKLIQKFNADYGPSKRPETTRAVEPRDPEKELIYPIDKEGFVGREYVDGELRYGVSWRPMWLYESQLGEKLINDFWREFLRIKGNIEVFKNNKRRQNYKDSTRQKRSKHD